MKAADVGKSIFETLAKLNVKRSCCIIPGAASVCELYSSKLFMYSTIRGHDTHVLVQLHQDFTVMPASHVFTKYFWHLLEFW